MHYLKRITLYVISMNVLASRFSKLTLAVTEIKNS